MGILGLLGNVLNIIVLIKLTSNQKENKNRKNFDRILISLSITDSLLLFMYITDALIQAQESHDEPQWYQVIDSISMLTVEVYQTLIANP